MTPSIFPRMEEYYCHDQLRAIWEEIGNLHMSYLEIEDSPQKLVKRHELEDTIGDFLSLAPHTRKFLFAETAHVLHRSASSKKDFSGYRAALGWNAIAMYAANLWNQPWRNEYKQIKLYSGYFKHQIDANLVGAEIIFELMGYKNDGAVLTLDGPICPDRVVSISQDALVAYVECQVLKAIWEEVSSNFKISWLEVLEFRQSHLCTPKHSIQALNFRCHERQFQHHTRSHSQGTDVRYSSASGSATLPSNYSFPPLCSQATLPLNCMHSNGYYPNNYPIYATPHPHHYPFHHTYAPLIYTHSVSKPTYNTNCHHPNGYSVPIPSVPQICPTAQLIEVESQHASESNKSPVLNSEESWDYVYKDLENQGYSKDLGERGDVLNTALDRRIKAPIKEAEKVKTHTATLLLKDKKRFESLSEKGITNVPETKTCNGDVITNKTSNTKSGDAITNKTSNTKTNYSRPSYSQSLGNNKSEDKIPKSPNEVLKKWQCATCTFLNCHKEDICEMCSKSKISVSDEMEIGGSQCSKCTLVNPKENKTCSACFSSLKGSPTYI